MIRDKRRLQLYTSLSLTVLMVGLGLLWASYAIALFRSTTERQLAEDNEVVKENLRIIISQVTQQYTDKAMVLAQIQKVLEALKDKGWNGFACVLDKDGFVLAHPRREMVSKQVPLKKYEPADILGTRAPPIGALADPAQLPGATIYKTQSDIIAIDWLPDLMTYLCVHQSYQPLNQKIHALRQTLAKFGFWFVGIAATGAWFFVGWLVDRYESHLARSEARNRVLVQNSAPILIANDKGQLLDANPAAETLFQVTRPELLQMPLADLWPAYRGSELTDILNVGATGVVEQNDREMQTLHGKIIPVDLRACRIDYGDREAVCLLIRDITESRRAREEILEANRKLRELDQLKTDFVNTVSHELRTPLTSIKWSTESLSDLVRGADDETVGKLLKIIRDDNQRLSALIEQLLSFSRIDAGKLKPVPQDIHIDRLLHQSLEDVSPIAQQKGIVLHSPPAGPSMPLKADPEQTRRVVVNILENAIKYTPSGGGVQVRLHQKDGWVYLAVEDNGIGIAPADLERIFDKFYRTDQKDVLRERGSGLGLAIVKGIVEAHGGHIQVQSGVGTGSTFTIQLPQAGPPPATE